MSATTETITPTSPASAHRQHTLKVIIKSNGRGAYRVTEGDRVLIERTNEPFLNSARALLAEGCDPDAILAMSREETPGRIDMKGRLGPLAKLAVVEGVSSGPRLAKWMPFNKEVVQ